MKLLSCNVIHYPSTIQGHLQHPWSIYQQSCVWDDKWTNFILKTTRMYFINYIALLWTVILVQCTQTNELSKQQTMYVSLKSKPWARHTIRFILNLQHSGPKLWRQNANKFGRIVLTIVAIQSLDFSSITKWKAKNV